MSIKEMSMVWDHCDQSAGDKLTLLKIADNANDEGYAFPGQDYLCKTTNATKTTLRERIKRLVQANELWWMRAPGCRTHYVVLSGLERPQRLVRIKWLKDYLSTKHGKSFKEFETPGKQYTTGLEINRVSFNTPTLLGSAPPPCQVQHPEPSVTISKPPVVNPTTAPVQEKNAVALYQSVMGLMVSSPYEAQRLHDLEDTYGLAWVEDAFKEAVNNNARKLSYAEACLKRWKAEGRADTRKEKAAAAPKLAVLPPPIPLDSIVKPEQIEEARKRLGLKVSA